MVETQAQTHVTVSQHGSLSLDTKLEGSSIKILNFYFPTIWHVDGFQGPVDFYGHNLWSVCKSGPSIPNFITKTCFQEGFAHYEAEENSHSSCPEKQSWRWKGEKEILRGQPKSA
jgi:hypothetical protein